MTWAQYSMLYQGILNQLSMVMAREEVMYLACMYSVLEGLQAWWVFVDMTIPNPLDKVLYATGKRSGYAYTHERVTEWPVKS